MELQLGSNLILKLTSFNIILEEKRDKTSKRFLIKESLKIQLEDLSVTNDWSLIRIHGEGYGGKQQGMSATYGPNLKFIVFDVYIDGKFSDVPDADAEKLAQNFWIRICSLCSRKELSRMD